MGQVSPLCQLHPHHPLTRWQKCSVDGEVCRAARKGLHVDSPLFLVESVGLEGPLLRQSFDPIDEFVSSVVTRPWVSLGVLVGEA